MRVALTLSASIFALLVAGQAAAQEQRQPVQDGATPANAQGTPPANQASAPAGSDTGVLPNDAAAQDEAPVGNDIVVTGIRASLARAAAIKRDAPQVVDSIVAQDIGKFPDATTAAALQRVPGVQVTVGGNNEIVNPLVRGLPDILTTLDGREIFTADSRGFAFQDLPAEAIARVDVFKSNTANLVEGGVAGSIDIRLNKAFNYTDPTIALSGKLNYPSNAEKLGPQVSFLATDRWDTGIGEIGALINVSWYDIPFNRPYNYVADRKSGNTNAPAGAAGLLFPISTGGLNEFGRYQRPQANGSLQWQAAPGLEVYVDGVYSAYRSKFTTGFYEYRLGSASSVTGVVADDNCFTANVGPDGFNPNSTTDPALITQQRLCNFDTATFNNIESFTSQQAKNLKTDTWLAAGGFKVDQGPFKANVDASFTRSIVNNEVFIVDVGKRIPTATLDLTNSDNTPAVSAPGNPMADATGYTFVNGLFQDYVRSSGGLFAVKGDASYEVGGILKTIEVGARYADRTALFQQVQLGVAPPGGSFATPITAVGLPMIQAPGIPQINNGATYLLPDRDFLLSNSGQEALRGLFGAPSGRPPFDPTRTFDVGEKTYAGYVQAGYEINFGGPIVLDGKLGVRYTRTDRDITGTGVVSGSPVTTTASNSDDDFLPNASARLQFGGGLQLRATYAKTLARPSFGSLNPGLNYIVSTNPNIRNGGSGGNPNLRPQKSDSFDATLEYYWRDGYFAIAGYYRDISDRVISGVTAETIDGIVYNISRPRNVGSAKLKGIEVSGQTFFSFLPGALSGFGVFGNFTLADSEVSAGDDLSGFPLQGVSKYNFNAGLLYDKSGVSARLVYTYRSRYFDEDRTGTGDVRPIDSQAWLNYVRPNGRLDFSIGYDVTKNVTVSVEGSNILRSRYRSYINEDYLWRDTRTDDSLYAVSVRTRF